MSEGGSGSQQQLLHREQQCSLLFKFKPVRYFDAVIWNSIGKFMPRALRMCDSNYREHSYYYDSVDKESMCGEDVAAGLFCRILILNSKESQKTLEKWFRGIAVRELRFVSPVNCIAPTLQLIDTRLLEHIHLNLVREVSTREICQELQYPLTSIQFEKEKHKQSEKLLQVLLKNGKGPHNLTLANENELFNIEPSPIVEMLTLWHFEWPSYNTNTERFLRILAEKFPNLQEFYLAIDFNGSLNKHFYGFVLNLFANYPHIWFKITRSGHSPREICFAPQENGVIACDATCDICISMDVLSDIISRGTMCINVEGIVSFSTRHKSDGDGVDFTNSFLCGFKKIHAPASMTEACTGVKKVYIDAYPEYCDRVTETLKHLGSDFVKLVVGKRSKKNSILPKSVDGWNEVNKCLIREVEILPNLTKTIWKGMGIFIKVKGLENIIVHAKDEQQLSDILMHDVDCVRITEELLNSPINVQIKISNSLVRHELADFVEEYRG